PRPPGVGEETGKAENRHMRHRMFAVVDRSRLTLDPDPNNAGQAGPLPFFIESQSPVEVGGVQRPRVRVPLLAGRYDGVEWGIANGTRLVVDAGMRQERVTVSGNPAGSQFEADFVTTHPRGFAISNAVLGHPGPQPRFDIHDPRYRGVVRYFSTVVR